jgi:TRAP-type C4-dicarboxylate transport system permease small subunit
MNVWQKIINIVEIVSDVVSGYFQAALIFLLMVMLLIEVLTRYVLNAPLSISEELGGYLLVAITFIGLAYTWKEKGHVRVVLLVSRLPEKIKQWLRLATLLLAVAFCFPLIKACYDLLQETPLVYPQTILIVGAVLLLLQLTAEVIKAIITLKKPKGDH